MILFMFSVERNGMMARESLHPWRHTVLPNICLTGKNGSGLFATTLTHLTYLRWALKERLYRFIMGRKSSLHLEGWMIMPCALSLISSNVILTRVLAYRAFSWHHGVFSYR